jgi:SAM-dependent methyltransferase
MRIFMSAATQRFSSRVNNYIRYRPSYPWAVIETLQTQCGLTTATVVADIGSGTGKLTELFLQHGNHVLGVEPNREMRTAGEQIWQGYPHFTSVAGTAEATTLPAQVVDLVVAGQAFHWFDPAQARQEFARILRPKGWVALIWNYRRLTNSGFMQAYEALLHRFSSEYQEVGHQRPELTEVAIGSFFGTAGCQIAVHPYQQTFDFAGLKGRLLSSSYSPEPGHPEHEPMITALAELFQIHQVAGQVAFAYDTKIYYGHLS